MKVLSRYFAGRVEEPRGVEEVGEEAEGAAIVPSSSGCEKSHSTARFGSPP